MFSQRPHTFAPPHRIHSDCKGLLAEMGNHVLRQMRGEQGLRLAKHIERRQGDGRQPAEALSREHVQNRGIAL